MKRRGFSLVEVAMALGIAAFVLISLMALVPLGIESNRISTEETQATSLLTALEADLRNSHPEFDSGNSVIFKLPLPYKITTEGFLEVSDIVQPSRSAHAVGIDDTLQPASGDRTRYQATIIYAARPQSNMEPIQARLVVNWPSLDSSSPDFADKITQRGKVSGYVETLISFPAP